MWLSAVVNVPLLPFCSHGISVFANRIHSFRPLKWFASDAPRSRPRLRATPLAALVAVLALIVAGVHSTAPATQEAAAADFATLAGVVAWAAESVGVS